MKTASANQTQFSMCRVARAFFPVLRCWAFFLSGMGCFVVFALALCAQLSTSAQAVAAPRSPQVVGAEFPFVGCKSDGQVGPLDASTGKPMSLPIAVGAAQQLAYYKSESGPGVLAPRGWYCFGLYGSNGYSLYVSPHPIDGAKLLSGASSSFDGPAIEIAGSSGGTSGRFEVARIIARLFPAHRAFVESVIAEGIEPASEFPFGQYPKDKLTYRSSEIVEYQTPPNTDGLGTHSRLRKNADPISGVEILTGPETSLVLLAVRLAPNLTDLTPVIIRQVERDAANAQF